MSTTLAADNRLPVTVLSGFLGAGLVRVGSELSRTDETLVEMSNGCIPV